MFTRAGVNLRVKPICAAMVWHVRGKWKFARASFLHRWVRSGDLAWIGGGRISWGEQLRFANFIHLPLCDRYGLPQSELPIQRRPA